MKTSKMETFKKPAQCTHVFMNVDKYESGSVFWSEN